ncbi:MAG: tetratricopeptide repeat protein, partial [Syntrophorhabdales bacterium]
MKRFLITILFVVLASPAFAVSGGTGSPLFLFLEGYESSQAGRYDEAIEHFKSALSRDPSSASIRGELALVYVKKGDYDKAETLLTEAVQIDPKNRDSLMLLSGLYLSKNKLDEARKLYERCVAMDD